MLDYAGHPNSSPTKTSVPSAQGGRVSVQAGLERIAFLERRLQALAERNGRSAAPIVPRRSLDDAIDVLDALRAEWGRVTAECDSLRASLARLRESEARWRSIVANPFDYVAVVDRAGTFQYVNRTAPGIRREDLIGRATMYDFTFPDFHQVTREALAHVFDKGEPTYFEAYAPAPVDGWFGTVVGPIVDDGRVVAASCQTRNITAQKNVEMALRESELRIRQLTDNIEDIFFLFDTRSERVLYVSPAYEKIFGYSVEALRDNPRAWQAAVHHDDREELEARYAKLVAAGAGDRSYTFGEPHEYRIVRSDGAIAWVRSRNFAIRDATGNVTRVAGIITDITERRLERQRLAEAESKYRMLVEKLPVISYIAAPDDALTAIYISPQVEAKLGFTQAEWTGEPGLWRRQIHPEDRERVLAEVHHFRATGEALSTLYRLVSRSGEVLWFRDQAVLVVDASGAPMIVEGVMLDVSEAAEARAEQQRARAFSARLVEVQENERRRVARELHDEIGQTLTGLHYLVQTVQECHGEQPDALQEARGLIGELMRKVRDLSLELRPSILDDLGLLPALLSMIERYMNQTQVRVTFEHRGIERRFDPEVETTAYRIVQEALTNVARHAGVTHAKVQVWSDAAALHIQVTDSGAGFDLGSQLADNSKNGLHGMRERVALQRGVLETETAPGRGTRLTVQMPVGSEPKRR
ncbi:MAG: PAS domain S-box protein [Candidatus Latescibacterota bacterium]|nr:MAG: PAS domain S-box protein [Candidatus Latescibacterota bacterium]